jgi:hypothetical protein
MEPTFLRRNNIVFGNNPDRKMLYSSCDGMTSSLLKRTE